MFSGKDKLWKLCARLRIESVAHAGLGRGGGTLTLPGEERAPRLSEPAFVIGAASQSPEEQESGCAVRVVLLSKQEGQFLEANGPQADTSCWRK